jgi:DNA-binding PadR family transcriptional regulator
MVYKDLRQYVWKQTYCIPEQQNYTKKETNRMNNAQKEVQTKLTKGLLDLIVLQFLETEPMHGYQIITTIRKSFGVYFGPSTIYPLLNTLEEKGYIKSKWNMNNERPRKVYNLTNDGKTVLTFTANSLTMICKGIKTEAKSELEVQTAHFEDDRTPRRIDNQARANVWK